MPLVVEEDEISDVVDIGLLRLEAEVLEPDRLSDLIEQARGLGLSGLWHCQVVDKIRNRGVIRQKLRISTHFSRLNWQI
jgi:hypothetical protein